MSEFTNGVHAATNGDGPAGAEEPAEMVAAEPAPPPEAEDARDAWNAAHRARLQERAQAEAERKKDLLAEAAGKLEALQAERARDLAAKIKTNRAAQEAAPFSALAGKLAEADPDRPAAESWELVCELLEGQTIEKLGAFKSTMLKLKGANF